MVTRIWSGSFAADFELDAGAAIAEIAHHAVHGRAGVVDLGDPAHEHLVARAVTPILHRFLRHSGDTTRPQRDEEGHRRGDVALT